MFLIWGQKEVLQRVGDVAEFCVICRVPRVFSINRLGMAAHLYFVPTGQGRLVENQGTCTTCGVTVPVDLQRYKSTALKGLPLEEVKEQTFPDLDEQLRERRLLEERIRSDPESIGAQERQQLILETFAWIAPSVQRRFAAIHIDKDVGLTMLCVLGWITFGGLLTGFIWPDDSRTGLNMRLVSGILLIAWQIFRTGPRFMERQVLPKMAKSLAPLRPTRDELEQARLHFRKNRWRIGSKLKVDRLLRLIEAAPSSY